MLRRILACSTVPILFVLIWFMACQTDQCAEANQTNANPQGQLAFTPPNNTCACTYTDTPQDQTPHWYASPEWWLVFIAIPTVPLIWYQARETARAAKATQASVNALIDSERPWLFIPIGDKFAEIQAPMLVESLPGTVLHSECTFRLKNYGRSPARVVEWKLGMTIPKDASYPSFSTFEREGAVRQEYTLPQGATIPVQATVPPNGRVTREEKIGVESGQKFLWLCGYIKYVDTFDRKDSPVYETRICYRWINHPYPPTELLWIMDGPPEYNRAR